MSSSSHNSNQGNLRKSKLDQIWNDLQTNLPQINFDDDSNDLSSSLDNDEEIKDLNLPDFNEEENLNEDDLLDIRDDDDRASLSDVYLNEFYSLKTLNKIKKNSSGTFTDGSSSGASSSDANSAAVKITKNIFDPSKTKLSMEIFNNINIDELLNSVNTTKSSGANYYAELNSRPMDRNAVASRFSMQDENVLKKLAEMSLQISNDTKLSNVDLKTGAVSSSNQSNRLSSTGINNNLQIGQGHSSKSANADDGFNSSPFSLILNELEKKDSRRSNTHRETDLNDEEYAFKNDLNKFLKSYNIKDGNLVETRRIDLRQSQHMTPRKQHVYSKPTAESLFQNILNSTEKDDEQIIKDFRKGDMKMKYINEQSSSDESSSDDDNEADSTLWIERYRKQKLLLANSAKK